MTCWCSKQETIVIGFVINYFLPIMKNVTIPYSSSRGFFRLFVVHCVYLTNSSGPAWMNKKDSHLSSLFSSQNICHLGFLNLETMNKKDKGCLRFFEIWWHNPNSLKILCFDCLRKNLPLRHNWSRLKLFLMVHAIKIWPWVVISTMILSIHFWNGHQVKVRGS